MKQPPADGTFEVQVRPALLPADVLIVEGLAPPDGKAADMPLPGEHAQETVNRRGTDRCRARELPRELPRRELLRRVRGEVPDECLFLFGLIGHARTPPVRGIAAVAAVVFCRRRSGAVAADYRREFENCSQFRFAMIARILPPVKCGVRNTPHLFIKVACLSPLFASPVPVPPPKIPKEKRRHPREGNAVFLELLMGFGSRLRARSSAALTGLAAARSRSGSDSPPDCHSLPSRRFATPDCHSLRSYSPCVSTGVSRGNATTNKRHLRPKRNVRGALPPSSPEKTKRFDATIGQVKPFILMERITGLEPATSTLARLRSTR